LPETRPQQFDLHAQLADALHGPGKFAARRIDLALLQGTVECPLSFSRH